MTTISRHTYTAETDLETVLSITAGGVTLDGGAIPHVEGRLTLAVEDAALLDELDPRDSRRVKIGATRGGHVQKLYSPWVEQRRNLALNPRAADVSGWNSNDISRYPVVRGVVPPVAHPLGITTAAMSRNNGTTVNAVLASFYNPDSLMNTGTPQRMLGVWVLVNEAGYRMTAGAAGLTWPATEIPANTWTWVESLTPVAAGGLATIYISKITGATSLTARAYLTGLRVVAGSTPVGSYFDGSTNPAGELQRTRWLGPVNNSASVEETRQVTGEEWMPEGFRYFDLGIRDADPDRGAGTVTLRLASDEAILMDYAQLVDGVGAWDVQGSLRAVCNYVLAKIGAALEPGTLDADVTAYWSVTNLHPNPVPTSAANYGGGAGAGVPFYDGGLGAVRWTSSAATSILICAGSLTAYRVTPGKSYVFTFEHSSAAGRIVTPAIQWRNNGSASTLQTIRGASAPSNPSVFQRHTVIATAPAGAEFAYPLVITDGNTSATTHAVRRVMVYEGDKLIAYYTGSTAADAHYTYKWADPDAPNASSSIRTPLVERRPESLYWPAGVSGMAFLEPLLKASGLRLVCDEQRRWWLRDAEYRADGTQNYRHAVNIEQATERLSRDDDSWFDAAVYTYVWQDEAGIEYRRVDSFALVEPSTKVLRVELRDTPYPGPGRAEAIVRRAQGRGRTVSVTAIPTWTEHTDQPLAILLEGTPIQTGIAGTVAYDFGADTVTVTSRTTDTPAAAWILIPTGERWFDSPAGESWTEEII